MRGVVWRLCDAVRVGLDEAELEFVSLHLNNNSKHYLVLGSETCHLSGSVKYIVI